MRSARQFYRIQKSKRYPPAAKATLLRPLKTLHQISLKHRRRSRPTQGKAITGCSRFDLPLLASYSRSGTNWIRYFIATCTGRPTPGQTRLLSGDDYIIDQAHCTYPRVHKYSNVILVIRDYRECLLRHNKDHWKPGMDITQFLKDQPLDQPCAWNFKTIQAFDQFSRDKLLLYYEDIINAPETEFRRLGSFLGRSGILSLISSITSRITFEQLFPGTPQANTARKQARPEHNRPCRYHAPQRGEKSLMITSKANTTPLRTGI